MRPGRPWGEAVALGMIMAICCTGSGRSQSSQEIRMKKMESPIKAMLGQNVTMPCVPEEEDSQDFSLSNVGVRWSRKFNNGSEINVYKRSEEGVEQLRPGSDIDEGELRRRNASLTLRHVRGGEEGNYTCSVFVPSKKGSTEINLKLFAKPNVTLSTSKLTVERTNEKSVTCKVAGYYPKEVKIQWKKYDASSGDWSLLDTEIYLSEPKENSDGSFNVSSILVVAPSSLKEDGDVYACVVTHESLSQDQNVNFTLTVTEQPDFWSNLTINSVFGIILLIVFLVWRFLPVSLQISDIVGLDDMVYKKKSLLAFMVSGFQRKEIEVHLKLKRADYTENLKSWKYPSPQAVQHCEVELKELKTNLQNEIEPLRLKQRFMICSCLCSTHITPDIKRFKGAELHIEVIHNGHIYSHTEKLTISEDESILSKHAEHQAGKEVELSRRKHTY